MLYGGLNQIMFFFLGFWRFDKVVERIGYAMHGECPAFFNASAYEEIALSNDSGSHDSWAILFLIMRSSYLAIEGWWLD